MSRTSRRPFGRNWSSMRSAAKATARTLRRRSLDWVTAANFADTGCPVRQKVQPRDCTGEFVLDVVPNSYVVDQQAGNCVVVGVEGNLWFRPDVFDNECCTDNLDIACELRLGMRKATQAELFGTANNKNLFTDANLTEHPWIETKQLLWYVQPELSQLTKKNTGGSLSCSVCADSNTTDGSNGYFQSADYTGTIQAGALGIWNVKEPHPMTWSVKHRAPVRLKDDESLVIIGTFGDPFNTLQANLTWGVDVWGEIRARVAKF